MKHTLAQWARVFFAAAFLLPLSSSYADQTQLRQTLQSALPQYSIDSLEWHEEAGLYVVHLQNGPTLHATKNGQYLIAGDLYKISEQGLVNETQQAKMAQVESLPEKDMVIFQAANEKAHITVFTDVDCGYCRMLHNDVAALNEMGISVRYLAYPRAGVGSTAYRKMVSIWCSDDPKAWMTKAKLGQDVPENKCANPVASQYQLGNELGVRGTPSIVLGNGTFLPGYLPPKELAARLGL
ncbi:thioredoxin fold domain-containing protein [Marinomonas sp. THO17]|uniref:thioredoxin fold domain-containing protein n=1 Tax=Marinomonas sp. THO17 TaxID=3149048 RepID=UPI00336C0E29